MTAKVTPLPKKRKKKSPTKDMDRLFSLIVRNVGRCELAGYDDLECSGALQCAHCFSRRYRTVRWDRRNAISACQAHHMKYTHDPLRWDEFLYQKWGTVQYLRMRMLATQGPKPDLAAIHARPRSASF